MMYLGKSSDEVCNTPQRDDLRMMRMISGFCISGVFGEIYG